jgi:pyridoxine 5-phosphate synthase
MAATDEMLQIALKHRPHACCLVPEKREEVTTEGGLDVAVGHRHLRPYIARLKESGARVSLFIDPDPVQLSVAQALGAPVVELHTGSYAEAQGAARELELRRLVEAAALAERLGLECHAGHGLTFENVGAVAAIPQVVELNIGHFLVGEAIFGGLDSSIKRMRALMDQARADATGSRSA